MLGWAGCGAACVVGTGPGRPELMTPASQAAVAKASDLVGYGPYLDRLPATRASEEVASARAFVEEARAVLSEGLRGVL